MSIRFGDLYEEMLALEQAIRRMELDIENAECDSVAKCRLEEELVQLQDKYAEISSADFEFRGLNFADTLYAIENCLSCMTFEGDVTDILPEPFATAENCAGRSRQVQLSDVEYFEVWELSTPTPTHYKFNRSRLPFTFTTTANEEYVVDWSMARGGLSIRVFNKNPDGNVTGAMNISRVHAVFNEGAVAKYGGKKLLTAGCKALLLTPTPMYSTSPLFNMVDLNYNTRPAISTTIENSAEVVLQFFV